MNDVHRMLTTGTVPFDLLAEAQRADVTRLAAGRMPGVSEEAAIALVMATMNHYALFDEGCIVTDGEPVPPDGDPTARDPSDERAERMRRSAAADLAELDGMDIGEAALGTRAPADRIHHELLSDEEHERRVAEEIVATIDDGDDKRARVGRLCRRFGIAEPLPVHGSVPGRLVAAIEARLGIDPDVRRVPTLGQRITALESRS